MKLASLRRTLAICGAISSGLAWAPSSVLQIEGAWIPELPPGQVTSVLYMRLHNGGAAALQVVDAHVDGAEKAQMHEHRMDNGMMAMRPVGKLDVAAGATQELAPGGYHLMLFGLQQRFVKGESVGFCLVLADQSTSCASATVKPLGE